MPHLTRVAAAATTVALLAALGACAGPSTATPGAPPPSPPAADVAYADRALAGPFPLLDLAFAPSTVAEALPTTSWQVGAASPARVSDLVVVGRFTSWSQGRAARWTGSSSAAGTAVGWDDTRAQTRELVMTFDVDRVVATADGPPAGDELRVTVGVAGDLDAAEVARGLVAGGRTVAFLTAPSGGAATGEATTGGATTVATPADAWRLAFEGGLLGRVADDGTITWGVLDAAARLDASRQGLADAARGLHVADLDTAAHHHRTIRVGG